jgi:hypothetical protein
MKVNGHLHASAAFTSEKDPGIPGVRLSNSYNPASYVPEEESGSRQMCRSDLVLLFPWTETSGWRWATDVSVGVSGIDVTAVTSDGRMNLREVCEAPVQRVVAEVGSCNSTQVRTARTSENYTVALDRWIEQAICRAVLKNIVNKSETKR